MEFDGQRYKNAFESAICLSAWAVFRQLLRPPVFEAEEDYLKWDLDFGDAGLVFEPNRRPVEPCNYLGGPANGGRAKAGYGSRSR